MKSSAAAVSVCLLLTAQSVTRESAAAAPSEAPVVVVLRGPTLDDVTSEAAARVEGELRAAGFRVKVLSVASVDDESDLESAGRELSPVAAFAIFARSSEGDGASVADILVTDRVRLNTVIQRSRLDHGNRNRESEILAVRAVELLKANLTEFWLPAAAPDAHAGSPTAPADSSSPAPSVVSAAPGGGAAPVLAQAGPTAGHEPTVRYDEPAMPAGARAPFGSGVGFGLGAGVMESFGAIRDTWAPTMMLSYGSPRGLGVRATVSGLGPSLTLDAAAGTARVEQQLATLEMVAAWWLEAPVVPFVCAGAGGLHVRVDGEGVAPYRGYSSDSWSVITSAGVGAGVPIFPHLSFVAEARGIVAWPPTSVQIASAEVGRIGGPSVRFDAGLLGVFR